GLLHLRMVSPALAQWIDNEDYSHILTGHLRKPDDPTPNYFRSLARGIISQQVSGAAAASILRKFIALFYTPTPAAPESPTEFFPSPQEVLGRTHNELRTAGLSERKAQYMHSLATEFIEDKSLTELHTLSNEDVIEKLTKVKGIGVWSAEMFLIFTLGRWDIFSVGDLGIQRGMAVWDGRNVNKLRKTERKEGGMKVATKWKYMSEEDMVRLSEEFKPWRTLFCLVMWRASDTQVASMKEREEGKVK
ncbi:DNA glycosylase, partial [Terfezia claveryi]